MNLTKAIISAPEYRFLINSICEKKIDICFEFDWQMQKKLEKEDTFFMNI